MKLPASARFGLALGLISSTTALLAPAVAQSRAPTGGNLTQIASFAHQVTGITVSRDRRMFVNFPRWSEDAPVSVAELKDGKPVAYPNDDWNSWRNARKDEVDPKSHFVCVQSVVADAQDRLWVVDAAAKTGGISLTPP